MSLSAFIHAIFPRGGETARSTTTRLEVLPFHKIPTGIPNTYTLSPSPLSFPIAVNPVRRPNLHHLLKFTPQNQTVIITAIQKRNTDERTNGYVWNLVGFITSEPQGTTNVHKESVVDFAVVVERVYDYVAAAAEGGHGGGGVDVLAGRIRGAEARGRSPPKYRGSGSGTSGESSTMEERRPGWVAAGIAAGSF